MNHKKILLVDDNPADRRMFLSIIEKLNPALQCIVATNGLEALTLLSGEENFPSIIFLDLHMQVMDGAAFLEHLPAEANFRNIPVVIFTSSDDLEDKKKCANLGARAFFTKTRDKVLLKEKIQEILEIDFTEQRRVT
jgi:CheY-like chemotaxis protein